jgi:ADP-heptose:LPS heptosyltransferase
VEVESVRAELAELPRPWIAVAAGAKWITKRWPTEHFASLLNRAHAHFGGTAIFVGAGDDTHLTGEVIQQFSGTARDFTGKTSLPRLAALLAKCDVMLANDTGPLHLAAALGTPCVAPYTCTRVTLHGPYGSQSGCVETSVDCGGSYLKVCDNMICMPELTPDKLWPRFAEVLDAWQRTHLSRSA